MHCRVQDINQAGDTLGAGPPPQFFTHVYFVNIALLFALHYYLNPLVAEDPSGATVCTTQWNKIQSCYTLVITMTQEFSPID